MRSMTWLDGHLHQSGRAFEKRFGPQPDGVRAGVERIVETLIASFPYDSGPDAGQRFEIDMLPHVHSTLSSLSTCLRLDPATIASLADSALDSAAERKLSAHFANKGFTYIDLPAGCYSVGSRFEVRAIFVRSATLLKDGNLVAPKFSPTYRVFDAIFGQPHKLSRQRLSWRLPGTMVVQAKVPDDPEYPGIAVKPKAMLQAAGMDVVSCLRDLMLIATAAIVYEIEHRGTSKASIIPRIPFGDEALQAELPDPNRTLLRLTQLSLT